MDTGEPIILSIGRSDFDSWPDGMRTFVFSEVSIGRPRTRKGRRIARRDARRNVRVGGILSHHTDPEPAPPGEYVKNVEAVCTIFEKNGVLPPTSPADQEDPTAQGLTGPEPSK